jgi:hypothetical protein
MRPDGPPRLGGIMGYGDDVISSDGFEPDDDEEFDSADYDSEFSPDDDIDWDDHEQTGS